LSKSCGFEGIVQRDSKRIGNRLKYIHNEKLIYLRSFVSNFERDNLTREAKTDFIVVTTTEFNVKVGLTKSCKQRRGANLEITPAAYDSNIVQHLDHTIISQCRGLIIS
jgi:hypothetical protein